MSLRWHELARAMDAEGESRRAIAALFGVSEAAVCVALRPVPEVVVPAWVPHRLARDFRVLARERGRRVAEAWARRGMGSRQA